MRSRHDSADWMWADALAALGRAERLHRQFFQPRQARTPTWEPPIDVLETEHEVLIFVALPGVDAREVQAVIDGAALVVGGRRVLPRVLGTAVIHRLELPQGRFERRVPLPPGRYSAARVASEHGCLVITLQKTT
ncbi:MAG: Hsp20/alpha crystallin family protein [Burkholderiaceae bacterium]|nr:Hsp20/alpha crystallin family protein [Burkholderiaceae bacterium]MEB2352200.1 Hsp20/alpha crystallin family protein [Burkholderiaceae bacterium]